MVLRPGQRDAAPSICVRAFALYHCVFFSNSFLISIVDEPAPISNMLRDHADIQKEIMKIPKHLNLSQTDAMPAAAQSPDDLLPRQISGNKIVAGL